MIVLKVYGFSNACVTFHFSFKPATYSMGIRGNYPKAGAGLVGMVAVSCRPLDVSSSEVKNKSSYTSTAPNCPSFQGLTNLWLLPVLLSTV